MPARACKTLRVKGTAELALASAASRTAAPARRAAPAAMAAAADAALARLKLPSNESLQEGHALAADEQIYLCLLYTSPSPRDRG